MSTILTTLLEVIKVEKVANPHLANYPRLIGAIISLKEGNLTSLNNWISLLESKDTPMREIMAVASMWDESVEEPMAYYIEITDELKEGLQVSIEAIGY